MNAATVKVSMAAIQKRAYENGGVHLLAKRNGPERSSGAVDMAEVELVAAAVAAANDAMPEGTVEAVEAVSPTPAGPLINLDHTDTKALNAQWLNTLAEHLAAAGWSGRVGPTKNIDPVPEWTRGVYGHEEPLLTVWAGVTRPANLPLPVQTPWWWNTWNVEPDLTRELVKQWVRWGGEAGGETRVTIRLASFEVGDADVAELLLSGLQRVPAVGAAWGLPDPPVLRNLTTCVQGFYALQVLQPGLGWQQRLDQLRPIMVAQAQHLDVAFIRQHQHTLPRGSSTAEHYRLPYFDGGAYEIARHVWYRHTPDAHGIQILTDSHLGQASDLTPLAHPIPRTRPPPRPSPRPRTLVQRGHPRPRCRRPSPPGLRPNHPQPGQLARTPPRTPALPRPVTAHAKTVDCARGLTTVIFPDAGTVIFLSFYI